MAGQGRYERTLRASKEFQTLSDGKKRRQLKQAQKKDLEIIEGKKKVEKLRKQDLEKLPARKLGTTNKDYTRKLVEIQAETDGIKKGEKLNNPEFSKSAPRRIYSGIVEKFKSFKKFWVIKTGKRGGKYTEAETKDGRPYRRYK